MENLINTVLFKDLTQEMIHEVLNAIPYKRKLYKKNVEIIGIGSQLNELGILLSGKVQIIKHDYWGNQTIVTELNENDMFGEVFAFTKSLSNVSVQTIMDSEVLYLNLTHLISGDYPILYKSQITKNCLSEFANKNLMLSRKIELLSKRTTRDKLLSYLSTQSSLVHCNSFDIPYNRQQLADYLCVDRSALSSELGRLEKENILTFTKNHFELLKLK